MNKHYTVALNAVEDENGEGGYYQVELVDVDTKKIVKKSELIDNLHEALLDFADLQSEWYEELGCCSTSDLWSVRVCIDLGYREEPLDVKYVVSLYGDDNHFYNNRESMRFVPYIEDATQFDDKDKIDIRGIINDCMTENKKYAGGEDTASLFNCKTIDEVNEKDIDYFFDTGLIKIIPVKKHN